MRILGIDPGSRICGYGVIDKKPKTIQLIEYGVIRLDKNFENLPDKMLEIYERITSLINRSKPDSAAFESLFYFKNAQSLVKLSHARAAAILATVQFKIPISEYSPREIKKSVTGNGNASKEQVQFMVRTLLKISETHEFYDATDALATAFCHSIRTETPAKTAKTWSDYIKNNPEKVIKY